MKTTRYIIQFIKILCIAIISFNSNILRAQDIHFSQIFETPLLRNPALSGIFNGDLRVQSVYRSQWSSVTVPYQTTSLNAEYKLPIGQANDFLTIGGQLLYDKAGSAIMTATHLLPAINYHKSLSEERNMYLSLAFMGGIVQRRIDRSKMTTNNQFDGLNFNSNITDGETFDKAGYSYWDGSAGLSFNSQISENENDNLYIGLAYHHFNKPKNVSFYSDNSVEMSPKWVASAGVRFGMTDYSYFTIESDYTKQGEYRELMSGALYTLKLDQVEYPKYSIHLGAYMRWKDAFIPVAKLDMLPLSIAVSYDANISALKTASNGRGGFEISLTYQKFTNHQHSSRDFIRCPRF